MVDSYPAQFPLLIFGHPPGLARRQLDMILGAPVVDLGFRPVCKQTDALCLLTLFHEASANCGQKQRENRSVWDPHLQ